MFNAILHMLGLCPDSLSHINLASFANVQVHEVSHIIKSLKSRLWILKKRVLE